MENSAIQQKIYCGQCTPKKSNCVSDLGLRTGQALKSVGENIFYKHHPKKHFCRLVRMLTASTFVGKFAHNFLKVEGGVSHSREPKISEGHNISHRDVAMKFLFK
jgi:hypothetical protein